MNEQFVEQLRDMQTKVNKMFYALMGNEIAKDGGLVGRIESLESEVVSIREVDLKEVKDSQQKLTEKHARMETYQKVMWTLAGGAAASIITVAVELFKK